MKHRHILLIGERNLDHVSHRGIEASLTLYREHHDPTLRFAWLGTAAITAATVDGLLRDASGVWCTPGSPYASTEGALLAIRHARASGRAFLGTCGGFQHLLMEFAQNELGRPAEHAEMNPSAPDPLIARLSCSLVEVTGRIVATDRQRFAALLGGDESSEGFHCNYGFNGNLAGIFAGSALKFVAHDAEGQLRAVRLDGHPFFVGTLFQPERRALQGSLHPVVRGFLDAAGYL
ncbi:MAG TPA: hypothetical protein VL200_01045 [Lacunisphaera sp.]|jgi:CTP synthase (UTP-ammonia lyase)|nr:hypothetical protein [Lacunisphaera sp.]